MKNRKLKYYIYHPKTGYAPMDKAYEITWEGWEPYIVENKHHWLTRWIDQGYWVLWSFNED